MTSPASSGPAGALFESQVGAYYLLSLLSSSEPRGLPGTSIVRIELQRADEGRYLDDIIIHAQSPQGATAVLEIQVKRSISFAPSDPVFKAVVDQIARAMQRPDFWNSRYELAVATAKTSQKIDGAYQEVLAWARQLGNAETFHARLQRSGSASDGMRAFVSTFRNHLNASGAAADDETVWNLLRRFQILVFDFTAPGSASEELAKERAAHTLHADDAVRADELWGCLQTLSLEIAASGGDRTYDSLVEDVKKQTFRLAGSRHFFSARMALADMSRLALNDMANRIGETALMRHERLVLVESAIDEGRYIEIRGDAGVGKSGLMRLFAEQKCSESSVIVLAPNRTMPSGWLAMKSALGFDGTLHEMMVDLACDGGATLFIDNLDFFSIGERSTIVDLVREAAKVPGVSIIATARRDFGVNEHNWLPKEALDQLGRAKPIIVDELTDREIDELRDIAPRLKPLLADDHPARDVVRNLFRLSRLASQPTGTPAPHAETDMAKQWWGTADGATNGKQRERARILRAMAEQALTHSDAVDLTGHLASPIDALIASGTLRDLGNDRMQFRHDVFREWGIANLLFSDLSRIDTLPLDRPISASLSRGVELTACMILEQDNDGKNWHSFLTTLSGKGAHGSWRRAALLGIVHSEIGVDLLTRVAALLFADDASLMSELSRIMMAVDVEPIGKRLAVVGVDPKILPTGIDVPIGSGWPRLIWWFLSLGDNLPPSLIPDTVDVYTKWSMGTLGLDALTPHLLKQLYEWLKKMEDARRQGPGARQILFDGKIDYDKLFSLESEIRTGFLLFCNRVPELAAQYLKSLTEHSYNDQIITDVLKMRGTLAQAAPEELAKFTAEALIQGRDPLKPRDRYEGVFGFRDHGFLPVSPNQGPFLELLISSPKHGLSLVRQLVDYAVSFYSKKKPCGENTIVLSFPDGERSFPWVQTYLWPRENSARDYSITSGLMALEAWAHKRIEAGEPFEKVLSDVLGPEGAPAAYLLVAVDLIISHWPASQEAAIPFLASPELLCEDLQRQGLDDTRGLYDVLDIFGLKALQKEPKGGASLTDLNRRPSRKFSLKDLLPLYVNSRADELKNNISTLLEQASKRLGPPGEQEALLDPSFMALHALNLLNPENWQDATIQNEDGATTTERQYSPPQAESDHLKPLQDAQLEKTTEAQIQWSLGIAVDNPSRSSPAFAEKALIWALGAQEDATDDEHTVKMKKEAIITAAMVAVRDGDDDLTTRNIDWIRLTFKSTLDKDDDRCGSLREGLRYNPIAIAFVGLGLLLKNNYNNNDFRTLLEIATRSDPASARGFSVIAKELAAVDERLPRSILRCALASRIRPNRGSWDEPEEQKTAREEQCAQRIEAVIDAEIAWLDGKQAEPTWPIFPTEPAHPRRRLRLPGGQPYKHIIEDRAKPKAYVEQRGAALWISSAKSLFDVVKRPWLLDIVQNYSNWTMASNGAGFDQDEDIDHKPSEWNDAYLALLAHCLPGLNDARINDLVLSPITSLPDESFFDITTDFLRSVDDVYFNNRGLSEARAVSIRTAFADRMMASRGWRRLVDDRGHGIEIHIGPAIASLFFNSYLLREAKCYLLPKGIDRVDPFVPKLQTLAEVGSSSFVAFLVLNIVEISPKISHLSFVLAAAAAWLTKYPNDTVFWIDYGIGSRVCRWLESVGVLLPENLKEIKAARGAINSVLAGLINVGVPEAYNLERTLQK